LYHKLNRKLYLNSEQDNAPTAPHHELREEVLQSKGCPTVPKRVKEGDRVVLYGEVTRVGEDHGDFTEITVQIDGYEYRVTLMERCVEKEAG